MNSAPIKVLVVDDSAVVRGLLTRVIERDERLQVVGTAMHGEGALAHLQRIPTDVVVLDVEMPMMDGLTALRHIQAKFPHVRVIMASSLTKEGAATAYQAFEMGAAGCVAKPRTSSLSQSIEQLSVELIPSLLAIRNAKFPRQSLSHRASKVVSGPLKQNRSRPQAIVIGASTGGPQALRTVLCQLPKDLPLPIFIVQHMPPLFTPMLARHLEYDTGRACREAAEKEPVIAGQTYIAPGGFHLELDRQASGVRARITSGPPEHFCRPSVNPLFRSASRCFGRDLLAVLLTGMGEDGLQGAQMIADSGGYLIAQDEATSVVWGMPGAVAKAGLANEVLPITRIGPRIVEICRHTMVRT